MAAAGKKALGMRYRLLPTLYSALHAAHLTGAPVMRPLFLNFPSDSNTHAIDRHAALPCTCCAWFQLVFSLLCSLLVVQAHRQLRLSFQAGSQ